MSMREKSDRSKLQLHHSPVEIERKFLIANDEWLDIGERNRHMEEGFGLVAARNNPMNLRKKEYFLTDKGHPFFIDPRLRALVGSDRFTRC
jgi:hypothetical protein